MCIEARGVDQSARSAEKKNSPSFFSYQDGSALVAPSCFALRVPDV